MCQQSHYTRVGVCGWCAQASGGATGAGGERVRADQGGFGTDPSGSHTLPVSPGPQSPSPEVPQCSQDGRQAAGGTASPAQRPLPHVANTQAVL